MNHFPIWTPEQELILPDFNDFKRSPRSHDVYKGIPVNSYGVLDTTRLSVSAKILGMDVTPTELSYNPDAEKNLHIDGENHCILRYRRGEIDAPANILAFDEKGGEVFVNQIQGTRHRVAAKVHATLDVWSFYKALLEENFFKNDIPVHLAKDWYHRTAGADMASPTMRMYPIFDDVLANLRKKYKM